MNIRTSETDPLRIAAVPVGEHGGAIGVTFAPGKHQLHAMTGSWARDLSTDLLAIKAWGADVLLTLLERQEFEELQISDLPDRARALGLSWYGLPITDGRAPDERFLSPWFALGPRLSRELGEGRRVVVHCKGGLGRAGTVACLLLMQATANTSADDAMVAVREARRGAIESLEQEEFLRAWQRIQSTPEQLSRRP